MYNKKFLKKCKDHFNEPVLSDFGLCRLIGYAEDDEDCYYILKYPNGVHKGISWHTFVGGVYFLDLLKNQGTVRATNGEIWSDFSRLDNILQLNGAEKEEEFILKGY